MSGSWGCPHDIDGLCHKVNQLTCDPGMKGCVLAGRYVFANAEKNQRLLIKQARQGATVAAPAAGGKNSREEHVVAGNGNFGTPIQV